jgi:hypothetical protein
VCYHTNAGWAVQLKVGLKGDRGTKGKSGDCWSDQTRTYPSLEEARQVMYHRYPIVDAEGRVMQTQTLAAMSGES